MIWWTRPLVRWIAAILLPIVVPGVITTILWALPGDPVEILCPPSNCTGQAELSARWHMDTGPIGFFRHWLSSAVTGDFGPSIRVLTGTSVADLLWGSIATTAWLVGVALIPVVLYSGAAAAGALPRRLDPVWQTLGLVPSVILALLLAAFVEISYGAGSHDGWPATLRLLFGALVLGVADGTLAGSVVGTRSVFDEEVKQRYILVAQLRGETVLVNALPNVLPALIGQFRGRVLQILSGAVVVEVVLGIPGVGELLWDGTLLQDFFVVLAAAWAFSLFSGILLLLQGLSEVLIELYVRRTPRGVA